MAADLTNRVTEDTVDALKDRLQLIDYALNGTTLGDETAKKVPAVSASSRLQSLQRELNALIKTSSTAAEVLSLNNEHPDIFHPTKPETVPLLSHNSLAALVMAHSPLYKSLFANLQALKDTSVPDPADLTDLVALQTKLNHLSEKQREQSRELSDLRMKSAVVLEQWYQTGVLDMGERWADWEERMREVEILVRRNESARKREDDGIV